MSYARRLSLATEPSPAFQFYVQEWRSSRAVQLMTFAERGMYFEMLCEQWEHYSLPDDPSLIARLCGGSVEEWTAAWPALRAKFTDRRAQARDGRCDPTLRRIVNPRLEEVRANLRRFKSVSRKGGLKRATSAKRGKDGTYLPADATSGVQPTTPGVASTLSLTRSLSLTRTKKKKTDPSDLSAPAKKQPDPRVKTFLTWFQEEYAGKRHGAVYLVNWQVHAPLVKRMLAAVDEPQLRRMAKVLLSDKTNEPFIEDSDRGIGILSTKFNWLSDRLAAFDARQPRPAVGQ